MRRFELHRHVDETGVSGTGVIAEGVEFTRGRVALTWLTATPGTTFFESVEDMLAVHGHGGNTTVEWLDPEHPGLVIPAKLGWANPDCGPEQMRLYALDAGNQPRWAKPHARTVETAIRDSEHWHEGVRAVVIVGRGR